MLVYNFMQGRNVYLIKVRTFLEKTNKQSIMMLNLLKYMDLTRRIDYSEVTRMTEKSDFQ